MAFDMVEKKRNWQPLSNLENFNKEVVIIIDCLGRLVNLLVLSLLDFLDQTKVVAVHIDWLKITRNLDVRCLDIIFKKSDCC